MPGCSDEELVQRFMEGNESALNTLLERYQKLLWKYICAVIHSSSDSLIDDIFQETWLSVIKSIPKDKFNDLGPGSFRAWLYSIARRLALKAVDRLYRQPEPFSIRFPKSLPEDLDAGRPDEAQPVECQNSLTNKLDLLLSALEPMDQRLFELKRQGLTYQEILQQDGFKDWSGSKLRTRFCRIMELLREKANTDEDKNI